MVRKIAEDQSEQKVLDDIATFGWHCVQIFAEGDEPGYCFTVGLFQSFGHPELIIFGLKARVAHQILCLVVDAAKAGSPLDLSLPTDALIEGYSCCFVEVPRHEYDSYVGFAQWYYLGNSFPLYQVVWPSRTGLFPWHPEATPEFRKAQPVVAQSFGIS
jgi:hypothetical protein